MASFFRFFRRAKASEPPPPAAAAAKTTSASPSRSSSLSETSAASSVALTASSVALTAPSATPSPPQPECDAGDRTPTQSRKRKTSPLDSGRTAQAVAQRWRKLNKQLAGRGGAGTAAAAPPNGTGGAWKSRSAATPRRATVKREHGEDGPAFPHNVPIETVEADDEDTPMRDRIVADNDHKRANVPDSEEEEEEDDDDDSGMDGPGLGTTLYPTPAQPQRIMSFKGSALDVDDDGSGCGGATSDADYVASEAASESESELDVEETDDDADDTVDENWSWLFEAEPPPVEEPDASRYWPVDEDETAAYEQGVAAIEGYADVWTADERRLHRLLALRGFHPLLPGAWTRDFLGVPMYPTLFAPVDDNDAAAALPPPVTITNYGSQFRATKALRALFDLQARVSGLRQTGHNTARIGAIIERELRRYIAWAAADAGLDRCGPLAAMPNIAAKQFLVGAEAGGDAEKKRTRKRTLARRVQDFFGAWVARYRAYYAGLPAYAVAETAGGRAAGAGAGATARLQPPRLLYGFVIVQHAVMLLVVDASASRSSRHPRPRCLANFNLSLGDRWLDASLNVAIPVHVARAALLRCRAGLVLPTAQGDSADDDA